VNLTITISKFNHHKVNEIYNEIKCFISLENTNLHCVALPSGQMVQPQEQV